MKYYQTIALALALVAAFGGVAYAETSSSASVDANVRIKMDPRRMEVREKSQEMRMMQGTTTRGTSTRPRKGMMNGTLMCEKLEDRIDARLEHFGDLYQHHKDLYGLHREKLVAISAKLKAEGVSTTKLDADIKVLDTKIAKFEADHDKVREALESAKDKSCTDSKEDFRKAVEAIRDAQKIVANDAREIFEFIRGTLRPDLVELRASFKAKAEVETNN